jgi:Acyl carrier protein
MKEKEQAIEEIICIIKAQLGRELKGEVTGDSLFREEISIDSLDMVLIIGEIEDTYQVVIDESVMAELNSVNDVVDYIYKQKVGI